MTSTVTTTTTIYDVDDEGAIAFDQEHAAEYGGWRKDDTAFVHCDMEARLLYSGPVPEWPRELDTGDYEPFRWVKTYRCAVCSAVFEEYENPFSYPTFWADVSSGTLPLEETYGILCRMCDEQLPNANHCDNGNLARSLYSHVSELLGRREPRFQDGHTHGGFIYICRLLGIPVKEMTVPHVPCAEESKESCEYCEYR